VGETIVAVVPDVADAVDVVDAVDRISSNIRTTFTGANNTMPNFTRTTHLEVTPNFYARQFNLR